ncbi:MAG: DUF2752 domain-containing protein [Flavobacteriaceae bacterium]|nr:DUF2752 domain-containing protein [Flavobacteriaceae bacterium]
MLSPEDYMLPCLTKKFFGIECFGCGFQRSLGFIFQGEFVAAFYMYPAIYTLFMFAGFLIANIFFKIKYAEKIKLILVVLNIVIIVTGYIIKINQ